MMVSREDAAAIVRLPGYSQELFSDPGLRDFAPKLEAAFANGRSVDLRLLISSIETGSDAVGSAAAKADDVENPVDTARDCIAAIRREEYERRVREISDAIANTTDQKERARLLREQMELVAKMRSMRGREN